MLQQIEVLLLTIFYLLGPVDGFARNESLLVLEGSFVPPRPESAAVPGALNVFGPRLPLNPLPFIESLLLGPMGALAKAVPDVIIRVQEHLLRLFGVQGLLPVLVLPPGPIDEPLSEATANVLGLELVYRPLTLCCSCMTASKVATVPACSAWWRIASAVTCAPYNTELCQRPSSGR